MKALIVIDVQNDFVTGALGTKQAVAILPNLKSKIDAGIAAGDEIIFTRDTHGADYADTNEGRHLPVPHCIKGTEGWQVVREIDRPDCVHIDKPTFGYTDWAALLGGREITEIEIVGVCTDICVISNALILKALFPEIDITVDAGCCAGVSPETHRAALTALQSCQIRVVGA